MVAASLDLLLETAKAATQNAAVLLRQLSHQPRQLQRKGYRDLVTDADYAAQKVVTEIIQSRFPDHAFLTEEEAADLKDAGPVVWVIDPIDGTTNYSRDMPLFTISVAAVSDQQEVMVAAICDPVREELFTAVAGRGAWLNGHPIRVSQVQAPADAIIGLDMSRRRQERRAAIKAIDWIGDRVYTIRVVGSAVMALAWVAAGRLDGYFNHCLHPWDTAAGSLLVKEAGGQMSSLSHSHWQWSPNAGDFMATNGHLHDTLCDWLIEARHSATPEA